MTAQELIAKVLELDAQATKNWTAANGSYKDRYWVNGTEHSDDACVAIFTKEESQLIASYRTAAPILARLLQKALEQRDYYIWGVVGELNRAAFTARDNAELDRIAKGEK